MKRIILLTIFVLISIVGFSQKPLNAPNGLTVPEGKLKIGATYVTPTAAELNYVVGVTSPIQTQLNSKVNIADSVLGYTAAEVDSLVNLKANLIGSVRKLYSSNILISNTGDTNENTILTFTIPANSVGVNGSFDILFMASWTSSTNNKTFKIKFNNTLVGTISNGVATGASIRAYFTVLNRNSLSSQISGPAASVSGGGLIASSTVTNTAYTINTAEDITVTVTAQLGLNSETMGMEAIRILGIQ